MYKIGDKVLCQVSPNLWKEGVIADDALAVGHWWVDLPGEQVCAHERSLKRRTSPNELTVVVNIDASAAIAEVDKLVDMMRDRMSTVVNVACKGDVRAATDLVRERDALREELAACKRERDATVSHLEAQVNDITWERDEARTKLAHANAEAAGRGRACDDLRAECAAMRAERDNMREALAAATTTVDTFVTGLENLATEIRKARGEEV